MIHDCDGPSAKKHGRNKGQAHIAGLTGQREVKGSVGKRMGGETESERESFNDGCGLGAGWACRPFDLTGTGPKKKTPRTRTTIYRIGWERGLGGMGMKL